MDTFHDWEGPTSFVKEVDRVIYIFSVSELCVRTPVPVESIYVKHVLRPAERFVERLSSTVGADETYASLNAAERLSRNHSLTAVKLLFFSAVSEIRVWCFLLSVFQRRRTQASHSTND